MIIFSARGLPDLSALKTSALKTFGEQERLSKGTGRNGGYRYFAPARKGGAAARRTVEKANGGEGKERLGVSLRTLN